MKKDMWKGTWTRGPALPGGNQGHTFAAKRSDDSNDEFNYVLKILKRQDDAISAGACTEKWRPSKRWNTPESRP